MFEQFTAISMAWVALVGVGLGIAVAEGVLIGRRRQGAYDWSAFWVTVRINLWRAVVEALPLGAVLAAALPLSAWMYGQRLWTVPMDTVWAWGALFLCTEFCYYWLHRTEHRVRWFWASHQAHHTGNQYNLMLALRHSFTGKVSGGFVFFAPQCLLGFSPEAVLLSYLAHWVYQFWIHSGLIDKLPWGEGVLNTPSAHRVHHAANVEYLDCNYGGTTLLFDRLFGTYVAEQDGVPIRYGLVKQQTSRSALKICLTEWWAILKDLRKVRGPRDLLGYLFGPPGWSPDGRGLTTEELRMHMTALTGQAAGVPPDWLLEGGELPDVDNGPEAMFSASPFPVR